jgi:arylsulfatase
MSGLGRGGTGELKVDGKVVATQAMERTIPLTLQWDESLDIGADTGTPVDDADYQVPFRFGGKLNKVTIRVQPRMLTAAEEKLLMQGGGRSNRASE